MVRNLQLSLTSLINICSVTVEHDFFSSMSALIGKHLPGDRQLPDWLEHGTDSSLRDTEVRNCFFFFFFKYID